MISEKEAFTQTNSKGVTYYLNMRNVSLRGGEQKPIYYFTKDFLPDVAQHALPDRLKVNENPRNGFLAVVPKDAPAPSAAVLDDDEEDEEY